MLGNLLVARPGILPTAQVRQLLLRASHLLVGLITPNHQGRALLFRHLSPGNLILIVCHIVA
jgi:hypothetical protein